jgi:hypothetical protein
MSFFRGRDGQDNKKPKSADDNKPANDDAPRKPAARFGKDQLRAQFNKAVKGLRSLTFRDLTGTTGQTLRDLRKPKEIGLLLVAIVVPGGMMGWGAYRLKKFKSGQDAFGNKPANENQPQSPQQKKPAPKPPRKKGHKPKPPGK